MAWELKKHIVSLYYTQKQVWAKRAHKLIVGWLITALYYDNLGYVLAQVVSLVFRKENARSKLREYTILEEALRERSLFTEIYPPPPICTAPHP